MPEHMPGERSKARQDFREARKQAFVNEIRGVLSGEPTDLLSFKEVQQRLGVRTCALGRLETVPLKRIVGSEGRYRDFDREFLPRRSDTESRWESLSAAFDRMENVPPVELYKVGEAYFVRDGNHRVSVARRHGAEYIDAFVIDCPSRVNLDSGLDVRRLLVEEEHLQFLERTHLDAIIGTDIRLTASSATTPGAPHRGTPLLLVRPRRTGHLEDAARSWYEKVYLPMDVIRRTKILIASPGAPRVILHPVLEHHHYFGTDGGQVSLEQAARSYARRGDKPTMGLGLKLATAWPESEGCCHGSGDSCQSGGAGIDYDAVRADVPARGRGAPRGAGARRLSGDEPVAEALGNSPQFITRSPASRAGAPTGRPWRFEMVYCAR